MERMAFALVGVIVGACIIMCGAWYELAQADAPVAKVFYSFAALIILASLFVQSVRNEKH